MDIEIARQSIYQAYLTLQVMKSTDPEKQQRIEELQMRMAKIKEDFEELVA